MLKLYRQDSSFVIVSNDKAHCFSGRYNEIKRCLSEIWGIDNTEIEQCTLWMDMNEHNTAVFGVNGTLLYTKYEDYNDKHNALKSLKYSEFSK